MNEAPVKTNNNILKYFIYVTVISLVIVLIMLTMGYRSAVGPFVVLMFTSLALFFMGNKTLRGFAFTIWVFASVATAMFYPSAFGTWFGFDLKYLIVPLIQIIMFGMGTTLSIKDFKRVVTMPWAVFIGMVLQFTVMPFAGLTIAKVFGFDPEVAAGVILIGSCPGGVASNLMTYLAGGNVALSVTMTACSTIVSPLMTPFMMKSLAGKLVPIDFVAMMLSILNMIIVPIIAGIIANKILYSREKWAHTVKPVSLIAFACIFLAVITIIFRDAFPAGLVPLRSGIIIGFALIGTVALSKLIVSIILKGPENWMDRALPIVSMAGIVYIIGIITARSRDKLITVGLALIAAAIIHNFIGYILGYLGAKLGKLDESSCRTVAIEVGLQNGGMASGLAMTVLNSADAAMAPAIFGPWMNISGSMLATWWHRKPARDKEKSVKKSE